MGMKQLEHAPPSRLGEIQARADAATAGPWLRRPSSSPRYAVVNNSAINIVPTIRLKDAEFIAHAREDVPELVEALRAVETVHTQELGGTPSGEFADICGGCPNYWPCPTITAIRGVLP